MWWLKWLKRNNDRPRKATLTDILSIKLCGIMAGVLDRSYLHVWLNPPWNLGWLSTKPLYKKWKNHIEAWSCQKLWQWFSFAIVFAKVKAKAVPGEEGGRGPVLHLWMGELRRTHWYSSYKCIKAGLWASANLESHLITTSKQSWANSTMTFYYFSLNPPPPVLACFV